MMKWIKYIVTALFAAGLSSLAMAAPSNEGIQVYQKNVHASPEHKQVLADDISRYRNADNLWDALREQFSLEHYENNPAVLDKIEWYMNNQDFLLNSATRAAPYLYYILQQTKKRHLPAELVLLPIIESGYNPFSMSPVGAAGIWQLMPGTASGFGVRRDSFYDGRRDVIASTRAALNYLAYLQSFFDGNWLLAIAAYNTGEGNVQSAIRRNIREGRQADFWYLPVAQQTRDYVPSLLALAVIISHPDRYPIYFPPVRNAPYLAQVDIGKQINLQYAAHLAGISFTKMKQLNSGFKSPSTSKHGPYKLVLPIENVAQFTENLARSPLNTQINWVHYRVKSGDTLASIAKSHSVDVSAIKKMNHLSKNTLPAGADIILPPADSMPADDTDTQRIGRSISARIKSVIAKVDTTPYKNYSIQPGDTLYMVRSKDSLQSIAKHYNIPAEVIQVANNLSSQRVASGKQLIIPAYKAAKKAGADSVQPGDTVYMIRRGDTIEDIAYKFHTSTAEIRLANLMNDNTLHEGEKLIIPTHITG